MKTKLLSMSLVLLLLCTTGCGAETTDVIQNNRAETVVEDSKETATEEGNKETTTEEGNKASETATGSEESAGAQENSEESAGEPESSSESSAEPEEERYQIAEFEIPDTEALSFVRDLKIGWNLGNTFDAIDCTWLSDEMDYESAWCGVKTTRELIAELKEAGFNTVRIPVSWHNHLTDKATYEISSDWLDRVNEVVDYCIDLDMYVILNIHHDNNEEFLYPSDKYLDQSVKYMTAIWSQLAEHFKEYDEKLIFAGMNEPRLVGHNNEWWLDNNNDDCKEAVTCINTLNQTFVNTVRSIGGNNASRYLICPGYDASADGALNEGFLVPEDPADNDHHIIVSVHAYTPYNFALEYPGTDTWSSDKAKDKTNMVGFMNDVYKKYVANGIPVVIDEFGARDKNGNTESRVDFAGYFVANARARGITCFWWDNNAMTGDGERFGLIDRANLEWVYPEIVEAMMKYAD